MKAIYYILALMLILSLFDDGTGIDAEDLDKRAVRPKGCKLCPKKWKTLCPKAVNHKGCHCCNKSCCKRFSKSTPSTNIATTKSGTTGATATTKAIKVATTMATKTTP